MEKRDPTSPILTTAEACQLLNIHSSTLRRWARMGIITAYRVGLRGDRRFMRGDIEAMLRKPLSREPR